jgi:hypothetical protein
VPYCTACGSLDVAHEGGHELTLESVTYGPPGARAPITPWPYATTLTETDDENPFGDRGPLAAERTA